jgi:hypothetical protein
MLQQNYAQLGRIPTFRFGRIESPLTTVAKSAGFENWDDLVASVRAGVTAQVVAPGLSGNSIANAILFKHACEQAGVYVVRVESRSEDVDLLTLAA